jgi:hypothetical protein
MKWLNKYKKAPDGGKLPNKPTLKEISKIPQKQYEPSDAVKNTKAGLGALSIIPVPLNPFGVAGSVYDLGTSAKYAFDGQWDKAGEDFVQAGLDLIPSTAGLLSGIKGAKLINKVNKARGFVALAKGVSDGKTIMEAPVITRGPIDWAGGVNRDLNPHFDARGYENQLKSPYQPPIVGEGAPYIKFDDGGEIDPMIQQRVDYTKSTLYKQRLAGQGVKNIDETVNADISNLLGTQFDKTNQQAQTTTRGSKPLVMLTPNDGRYVKAHEIGHAQRGGENILSSKNPDVTKEGQLSPNESWQFYNRNTNLAKPTKESVYDPASGKMVQKDTTFKNKVLNDYKGSEYFPNDAAVGRLPQWDAHDISSREGYGDLSAVRQVLLDNKITKSYGENITPEQWQKALQNKKISGEKHIQRGIKNYGNKGIVDLNNTVAYQDNSNLNEITPIAENGDWLNKYKS